MFRSEFLGNRNGKTITDSHAEADNQEIDGAGSSHRSQRVHAQIMADNYRVHHTVELLEHKAEQKRHGKSQNQSHRTAFRHIFFHNKILLPFSSPDSSSSISNLGYRTAESATIVSHC